MEKCKCWREEHAARPFASGRCSGTKELDLCDCGGDETKCDFYPERRRMARRDVESAPTNDAVQVVRCRDCIHYKPEPYGDVMMCYDFANGHWPRPDDYCSRGLKVEA